MNGKGDIAHTIRAKLHVNMFVLMPPSDGLNVGREIESPSSPLFIDENNIRPIESFQERKQLNSKIMTVGQCRVVIDVVIRRRL